MVIRVFHGPRPITCHEQGRSDDLFVSKEIGCYQSPRFDSQGAPKISRHCELTLWTNTVSQLPQNIRRSGYPCPPNLEDTAGFYIRQEARNTLQDWVEGAKIASEVRHAAMHTIRPDTETFRISGSN